MKVTVTGSRKRVIKSGHKDRVRPQSLRVIVTVNRVREYEHSDRQQGSRVRL